MKPEDLTTWVLEEASPEERAAIESQLTIDPKLKGEADATRDFCALLAENLGSAEDALTETQRSDVERAFTLGPERRRSSKWHHRAAGLAAAAAAVVATLLALPLLFDQSAKDQSQTASSQQVVRHDQFRAPDRNIRADFVVELDEKPRDLEPLALQSSLASAIPSQPNVAAPVSEAYVTAPDGSTLALVPPASAQAAAQGPKPPSASDSAPQPVASAYTATNAVPGLQSRRREMLERSGNAKDVPLQIVAGRPVEADDLVVALREEKLPELEKLDDTIRPQLAPADPGNETYTPIHENPFKPVAQEPLSTFSIDVDTASYANVRRFLNDGQRPPPDAVRIEELVNYFDYDYEQPADDSPFSVQVDLAEAPWNPAHRLARIGLKGREIQDDRKAGNFVFLVDVSGSMNSQDKLPLVQKSLRLLAKQLGDNDRVAIVTYAGSSGLALESTTGADTPKILEAIDRMKSGGSTHGSAGIRLAYEQAAENFIEGGINRVILCTDGDFNVGISDPAELETVIAQKAKSGVFLSVLGFGTGNLKDRTMETLADKGNGNYAYIDSLGEARKVLVQQMNATLVTIAKDVKIQVEFNPAQVQSYRLIGYENRMLAKEDFNDDTKDAGEIGAGHVVTALYELVPVGVTLPDQRPVVDDLKYQAPVPAAKPAAGPASSETMTVKLRYKQPDGDMSKLLEVPVTDEEKTMAASPGDFQFASAVAGFGMLLRNSAHKGKLTWDMVRKLALEGKGRDQLGYRGEFIQLIDKAQGVCER